VRLACECGGCGHGDERCRWSKMLSQNVLFVSVKVEWLSLDWWERVEWQTMTIVSVSLIISVA